MSAPTVRGGRPQVWEPTQFTTFPKSLSLPQNMWYKWIHAKVINKKTPQTNKKPVVFWHEEKPPFLAP